MPLSPEDLSQSVLPLTEQISLDEWVVAPETISPPEKSVSFSPLVLAIREQHFEGHFAGATISVDGYNNQHGLIFKPLLNRQEYSSQKTVTAEQIAEARLVAAIAYVSGKADRVMITINDSQLVTKNDRNAPVDGNAPPLNPNEKLVYNRISHKVKTGDSGDDLYNWKPLDPDTIVNLIPRAIAAASTLSNSQHRELQQAKNSEKKHNDGVTKKKSARRKKVETRKMTRRSSNKK